MRKALPIRKKIARTFLIGSAFLLFFYGFIFMRVINFVENHASMQRLELIAPYHLKKLENSELEIMPIDPLITIYRGYASLPTIMQSRLTHDWTGSQRFIIEESLELNVFAQEIDTPMGRQIAYAIESIDVFELNDLHLVLIEIVLFCVGLALFFTAAFFIVQTARKIGMPFQDLAQQLEADRVSDFSEISIQGELSEELIQTREALNNYRARIRDSIAREKAFTRYVSHELRTPMTVIKGCLGILRRQQDQSVLKQCRRIGDALGEMEKLTLTFLLLARNQDGPLERMTLDEAYLQQFGQDLENQIRANHVTFQTQVQGQPVLNTHPTLLNVLIKNLLLNAVACTGNGRVDLVVDAKSLKVIDTGFGLGEKPRGYEGFGIGLHLVRDICAKFDWVFTLEEREPEGCVATVTFFA